jgi:hypothetical protein
MHCAGEGDLCAGRGRGIRCGIRERDGVHHQGEGRVQADERRHQAGGAPAQQVPRPLTRPLQARTARLTRAQGMGQSDICTVDSVLLSVPKLLRMRSSLEWMRSSLVVRASDCQCRSPGFDLSILRHSGI